jgi:hypothetical protein
MKTKSNMFHNLKQIIQGADACTSTVVAEIVNYQTSKQVDEKKLYQEVNPGGGGNTLKYVLDWGKSKGLPLKDGTRLFIKSFFKLPNSYGYAEIALEKQPCAVTMKFPTGINRVDQMKQNGEVKDFFIPHTVALVGSENKKFLYLDSVTDYNGGIGKFAYQWFGSQVTDLYTINL